MAKLEQITFRTLFDVCKNGAMINGVFENFMYKCLPDYLSLKSMFFEKKIFLKRGSVQNNFEKH